MWPGAHVYDCGLPIKWREQAIVACRQKAYRQEFIELLPDTEYRAVTGDMLCVLGHVEAVFEGD